MTAPSDKLSANIERLQDYLARNTDHGILNLIDGESCASSTGEVFETHSPVDESLITSVARGSTNPGRKTSRNSASHR